MTLTEKILAKHSDNTRLQPGANIWTNVDKLLTHDVCGPGTFGIFEKEFGAGAQVWDPEKVIIIPDHYIFTSDPRANRNVDILRYASCSNQENTGVMLKSAVCQRLGSCHSKPDTLNHSFNTMALTVQVLQQGHGCQVWHQVLL